MDFRFTPEEEAFQEEVREFLRQELTQEVIDEYDEFEFAGYGPHCRQFLRKLGQRGWLGITWPKEYGGLGETYMKRYLLAEELDYAGAPVAGAGASIVGPCLMLYGTEEQKERFLPRIARGEIFFGLGYTEPNAGSDLASLQLRAVQDGDDFVLNGQKIFNTETHVADYIWLAARTDPDAPKHRGISVFIVDAKSPGITVQRLEIIDGARTNLVFYDNVRVPRENLVGEMNRGWYYVATALDFERVFPMGDIRRLFEDLLAYAGRPGPDGKVPAHDPHIRERLGQMAVDVEAVKVLAYRAAWMRSAQLVPNYEASMLKLFASEVEQRISNLALDMMGLYGMMTRQAQDAPEHGRFSRYWLTAVRKTIVAGTSEIQRNIIATRGLGLPRS